MGKREHERAIFDAFLRVAPQFADEALKEWSLPQDCSEFPDITCTTLSGHRIGVELGEWLNEDEMCKAKGMERIQSSILSGIGHQGENKTDNILFLLLKPKPKPRVKPEDVVLFREELFRCIEEVDHRWPNEPLWHNPPSYELTSEKLFAFPMLQKYLVSIHFSPRKRYEGWPPNGGFVKRTLPREQDWIVFPCRGGSFDQDSMLQPLLELVAHKKERYGGCGTGFEALHLIIYYNSALIYNSPAEFEPHFTFKDAADRLREFIGDDPDPFDRIFLFVAINGGSVLTVV